MIFFKGVNPWVWPKNGHFSKFFFLGYIGQENVFNDILEPKNAFLSYKNKKFKKSKNWHFSKGFGPKMAIFPTFFFRQYRSGKCVLWYSRTKKRFLSYKNKKFKKSKNWHFYRGVNPWFCPKNGHFFQLFFFRQFSLGKNFERYFRTKKRLSKLKKQEVQKVRKLTFFQRG